MVEAVSTGALSTFASGAGFVEAGAVEVGAMGAADLMDDVVVGAGIVVGFPGVAVATAGTVDVGATRGRSSLVAGACLASAAGEAFGPGVACDGP